MESAAGSSGLCIEQIVAVPKETRWEIDDHTRAKHAILRAYLNAWFPILGSSYPTVVFVDGFCGPGRYTGGERGSPLVALDAAIGQVKPLPGKVVFLFTDDRQDRIEHLKSELSALKLPSNFHVDVEHGRFDEVFSPLLDDLAASGEGLAPTFAFLDPFGFAGLPFRLVARILANEHCEVFITFMVNAVQRFLTHPEEEVRAEIRSLFGTEEAFDIARGGGERTERLRALYQGQLRNFARFVRSFEIRDTPGHVLYYLFFASNNPRGHKKMKEAMWRADPEGQFRFVDNTDPGQLVLLSEDPTPPLSRAIGAAFVGKQVKAGDVIAWVMDETVFLDKHTRAALKAMERTGELKVKKLKATGEKRRAGTFPADVLILFK